MCSALIILIRHTLIRTHLEDVVSKQHSCPILLPPAQRHLWAASSPHNDQATGTCFSPSHSNNSPWEAQAKFPPKDTTPSGDSVFNLTLAHSPRAWTMHLLGMTQLRPLTNGPVVCRSWLHLKPR